MPQQRGLAVRGLREVAEHAVDGHLGLPALQQVEDGRVAVLAVAGEQVQVEEAHLLGRRRVLHLEEAHGRVPRVEREDLREHETQQLLVDAHRRLDDVVQGEVLLHGLVVHAVVVLEPQRGVEGHVARLELGGRVPRVRPLQVAERVEVRPRPIGDARRERAHEGVDVRRRPGHARLRRERGPARVAEQLPYPLAEPNALGDEVEVVSVGLDLARGRDAAPRRGHGARLEHGDQVRVLEGHQDVAVSLRPRLEPALVQTRELLGREEELRVVLGEVLLVPRADRGVGLAARRELGLLRRVQTEAAPLELAQDAVDEVRLVGAEGRALRRGLERADLGVDVLERAAPGLELREARARAVGGLAQDAVRRAVLEELGLADGLVGLEVRRVHEGLDDRRERRRVDGRDGGHRRLEFGLDVRRERVDGGRRPRPDEGRQVIGQRRRRRQHAGLAGPGRREARGQELPGAGPQLALLAAGARVRLARAHRARRWTRGSRLVAIASSTSASPRARTSSYLI